MDTLVSGVDTWLLFNGHPLSFQQGNDNVHVKAIEYNFNIITRTQAAPQQGIKIYISDDDKPLRTTYDGSWAWIPKDYADLYELWVEVPNHPLYRTKLRLHPQKLTYERRKLMLSELSLYLDILFSLSSPVGKKAIIHHRKQEPSALREYKQIEIIVDELKEVMTRIRRNPHCVLQQHSKQRLVHEVHQCSSEMLPTSGNMLRVPTQMTAISAIKWLPETWIVQQNTLTYDTYENRLLKRFMQHQLLPKLSSIQQKALRESKKREEVQQIKIRNGWKDDEAPIIGELDEVVDKCQQMARWCITWLSEPFLASVQTPILSGQVTQVLAKNPFYSHFYRLYLMFQQELRLNLDTEQYLTTLALRKMSNIYEIWSVFKITWIVLAEFEKVGYHFASSNLFYELEKDYFHVDVRKNVASIILVADDTRVEIKYEPKYLHHLCVLDKPGFVVRSYADRYLTPELAKNKYLTPDMAIEVYKGEQPTYVAIFDAKYRWDKRGRDFWYQEDDLNKMWHYLNSICCKSDPAASQLQDILSSAYILYPGTVPDHVVEYVVGALPLIPNMRKDYEDFLKDTITGIFKRAGLLK